MKKFKRMLAGMLAAVALNVGFYAATSFYGIEAYAKERDSVYLKTLSINKNCFKFTPDVYYYTSEIDKDVNEIKVRAVPKNEDACVTINGIEVDKDDDYKRAVDVHYGDNIIKVEVTNSDDDKKTYIINVIQGEGKTDDVYLENLNVNGNDIGLTRQKTKYKMTVENSVKEVTISAKPEDNNYEVKIDDGVVSDKENYEQKIDLRVGENPIPIKVKKKDLERDYMIYITRKSAFEDGKVEDDVYLRTLRISDGNFDFVSDKNEYEINVKDDVVSTEIKADPDKDNYKVKIGNKVVEAEESYKESVKLNKGKNVVKIVVQDEENNKERVYTLNINRGKVEQQVSSEIIDTNENSQTNPNNESLKCNQWVNVNGEWQYNDALGNPLKGKWFYDNNYKHEYYLNDDGIMAKGWLNLNGNWYYLNSKGEKQTGWQYINEKWYFLYDTGVMAANTTINGYAVNADGEWVD